MQHKLAKCARAFLITLYSGLFCFTTVAVGQTTLDLDPPEVTHTVPVKILPGTDFRIDANVTDDRGVERVTLHFRSKQSEPFQSTEMKNVQGAEYTASIPTEKDLKTLQYYIDVLDAGGNRVLEGTPSTPLTITVENRSNILYIVLGAVAIGVLAGLAGGGGSDQAPDPGSRVLTINTTVPE